MASVNDRSTRLFIMASALAGVMVLAWQTDAEARDRSPFGQLRASIHELFSPPRRVRRAKPKPAEAARERAAKTAAPEEQPRSAAPRDQSERRHDGRKDASQSAAWREAVPQPRPRPAEAPPRAFRTAKVAPSEPTPQPRPRPPQGQDRTAAIPPPAKEAPAMPGPGKDAPGETESSPESAPPATPPGPSACQLRLTAD